MRVATITLEQTNKIMAIMVDTPWRFSSEPIKILESLKFAEPEVTPIEAEKVE